MLHPSKLGRVVRAVCCFGEKKKKTESILLSSVAQSCLTLCNPMDCSTSGLPVHHQLLELTQTHVRRVGDAIQPSNPLLSPSPLPSIFPNIRVFSIESVLRIRWPKYWSFSIKGNIVIFNMTLLLLLLLSRFSRVRLCATP